MRMKSIGTLAVAVVGILSFSLSLHRSEAVAQEARTDSVGAELQQEISQALWGCYAVGEELVGTGDVQNAKAVLRRCYTDDMQFQAVLPPTYASLDFTTTNGADGFVDTSNTFYRALGLVDVKHLITNIVIKKTGLNTATVNSDAVAVHTFADDHTFTATVAFVNDFQRTNGAWKITHTTMTVSSITQEAAWVPTASPNGN